MKKKTIFKVLPALLIAPILACCITLYANASEAEESQTFFDKLITIFFQQNEVTINADSDSFDSSNGLNIYLTNDGNLQFELRNDDELGESVAWIVGFGANWKDQQATEKLHKLEIPTMVTGKNISDKTEVTCKVRGIKSGALQQNTDAVIAGHTLEEVYINGWDTNGGGWFKTLESTCFQGYYDGSDGSKYYGGSLQKVTLPDCLNSIGPGAFTNDANLQYVWTQKNTTGILSDTPGLPSNLTRIGNKAFMDCSVLSFDDTKTLVIPEKVVYLEYTAFKHCFELENLIINSTQLTVVGGDKDNPELEGNGATFESCTGLKSISFDNATALKKLNTRSFADCTSLQNIIIPGHIKELEAACFANCYNLNNIDMQEGVEQIGQYCFAMQTQNATNVATLEYVYIPESVKIVNVGAFQNNKQIREIIVGMYDISNGTIYDGAFANLPNLISITFLWNTPRQLYTGCFKTSTSTAYCDPTGAIDVRFRPLISTSELGGWGYNYWVQFRDKETDQSKWLDKIVPEYSRLMLIAAFDDESEREKTVPYGYDLKKYLNENSGMFDNGTFQALNENLDNHVQYTVCITIPDVLKLKDTGTPRTFKAYAATEDTDGNRSKGIEFLFDDTEVNQTNPAGKEITRPADDGVLIINNNAIQANSNNTLYVNYRSKSGTKSNPCVWGHIAGNSNPFQNTYNYLTAEASQMDSLGQKDNAISKPIVCDNEIEDEILDESSPVLFSFGSWGESDVTIPNGCCFFAKPGGTKDGKEYKKAKLAITNVTFGGKWTDNSVPKDERTTIDVGNTCQLGCIYNDGDLTMSNCTFQNSVGSWSGTTTKGDSYGGSCLFNFRDATLTNCTMANCKASYDGGAIMNAGSLEMKSCIIDKCTAGHYGGAIFVNLGDDDRDATGNTELIVEGCTFTNNSARTGGAIHYCNGSTLKLDGYIDEGNKTIPLTFSGNSDEKGTCDVYVGTELKATTIKPFTLGNSFESEGKITLAIQKAKAGVVVCSGGASDIDSFASQNVDYEFETSGSDIVLKTVLIEYTLTTDGKGTWVDEKGNTVRTFTAAGGTAPEAGQTITYKDAEGKSHTLTAKANEGFEFGECTLTGTTYNATFKEVTPSKQKIINMANKVKESINNRNADIKETLKAEIYGK